MLSILSAGWEVCWLSEVSALQNFNIEHSNLIWKGDKMERSLLMITSPASELFVSLLDSIAWLGYGITCGLWVPRDLNFQRCPVDLLPLVTPGQVTCPFQIDAPGACWQMFDLDFRGWTLQKQIEVQLYFWLLLPLFPYSLRTVIIPGKIFSGCPKVSVKCLLLF